MVYCGRARPGCLKVLRGDGKCSAVGSPPSIGLAGTPEIKFLRGRKCRLPRSPSLLSWLRQVIRGAVYDVERKRESRRAPLSLPLSLYCVHVRIRGRREGGRREAHGPLSWLLSLNLRRSRVKNLWAKQRRLTRQTQHKHDMMNVYFLQRNLPQVSRARLTLYYVIPHMCSSWCLTSLAAPLC